MLDDQKVLKPLGAQVESFWKATAADPYQAEPGDLPEPVSELLAVQRPERGLRIIYRAVHQKLPFETELATQVMEQLQIAPQPADSWDVDACVDVICWQPRSC